MYVTKFPIYNSYRSAWVTGPNPVEYPSGIINLGYQGLTDNSIVSFGTKKYKKNSSKSVRKSKNKRVRKSKRKSKSKIEY